MPNTFTKFTATHETLPDSIKNLITLIIRLINPEEIILFGSRARGDHRENSDFDIVVKAPTISPKNWAELQLTVEETPITLFRVDLVDFNQLDDKYKKRISSEGKTLYAH